eukprot:10276631-Ditylum_brightwellii.AAC.1
MYAKQLILGTGQYNNVYHTWVVTPAPKTYQILKTHFTAEYQLLNRMKHTTRAAGYNQMNFAAKEEMDVTDYGTASLQLNKTTT